MRCRPLFCPRCPIGRCRPFEHASGGVWPPHWHHLLLTLSFLSSLPLMWKPPCLQLCNVQYYLFCERLFKTATQSWCPSHEGRNPTPDANPNPWCPHAKHLRLRLRLCLYLYNPHTPCANPGSITQPYPGARRPRATPSTAAMARRSRRWTAARWSCRTTTYYRSILTSPSSAGMGNCCLSSLTWVGRTETLLPLRPSEP